MFDVSNDNRAAVRVVVASCRAVVIGVDGQGVMITVLIAAHGTRIILLRLALTVSNVCPKNVNYSVPVLRRVVLNGNLAFFRVLSVFFNVRRLELFDGQFSNVLRVVYCLSAAREALLHDGRGRTVADLYAVCNDEDNVLRRFREYCIVEVSAAGVT